MKYRLNLSTLASNVEGQYEIRPWEPQTACFPVYGGIWRTLANGV